MTDYDQWSLAKRQALTTGPNGSDGHYNRAGSVVEIEPVNFAVHSSLAAYWSVLSKRRWELLTSVLVVVTLVTIYSFKMKPVYRPSSRVEIEAETPQIQLLNELNQTVALPVDVTFLKTQVRVLESDTLAWQVIEQLGLDQYPEFARLLAGRKPGEANAARELLLRNFRERLSVSLAAESRMVEVSFESTQPELAARVVNALVSDYVEYNFHMKYDATRQASGWMEQQLDELKAKVEKSQQALVDYERRNAIVNVSDKQNVAEQRLEELSKNLTGAENDLAQKQSLYELVQANAGEVGFIAQDELLQKLEEKYADLKAQYVEALGQYGPNFPKVVRLRDEVNEIQSLITRERQRTVERIRGDYKAATGRERLLAAAVAQQKAEVGELNQSLIQHNLLKREFDSNQQLYEGLLQRLKNATVSAGLRATNIHVVDTAQTPTIPVRPKKVLNLTIGLVVGLLLGITLAFVQESLDFSVRSAEEVEGLVGLPSLAVIPSASSASARQYPRLKQNSNGHGNGVVALTVLKDPASPLAESYRTLRTSILLSRAARPPQALLVTSAQPGEGKTTTALNLSLALAQRGSRVLILDADLRKPGVAAALGVPNDGGLSSVLTGAQSVEAALQRIDAAPGLWVLASGPRPPNPAELLSSPSMADLLAELRTRFDHLVLDSPPSLLLTDATVLSNLVDGVLLVVEGGVTARGALIRAHRILQVAGGHILGVVMNKVDLRHDGYDSYYSYGYRGYNYFPDKHNPAAPRAELIAPTPKLPGIGSDGS